MKYETTASESTIHDVIRDDNIMTPDDIAALLCIAAGGRCVLMSLVLFLSL
jgi:hypothetical protein